MTDKWKAEARRVLEEKIGVSLEKVPGNKEWVYETMRAQARCLELEDECKTSALQAKMAIAKQLELEEALQLVGECTACPSCKHRALDALAGGASNYASFAKKGTPV